MSKIGKVNSKIDMKPREAIYRRVRTVNQKLKHGQFNVKERNLWTSKSFKFYKSNKKTDKIRQNIRDGTRKHVLKT